MLDKFVSEHGVWGIEMDSWWVEVTSEPHQPSSDIHIILHLGLMFSFMCAMSVITAHLRDAAWYVEPLAFQTLITVGNAHCKRKMYAPLPHAFIIHPTASVTMIFSILFREMAVLRSSISGRRGQTCFTRGRSTASRSDDIGAIQGPVTACAMSYDLMLLSWAFYFTSR